ncbi:DEAD/DEAH box helicase family protein [Streptomyces sp. NBC_00481]|uniref:DEAD/DEAH box helicase n=1 Tax=Streptomyces sp. NBC_00481 TaxID=2975755 RepID=UPI002DD889C6|nr:DEAD/DEAH box helicase family protein [Streptomyces sp. NBC_00481]WRZ01234.1 DEAD/DEAH box helicase family protein [Streptomyces sp. NBC_00481]
MRIPHQPPPAERKRLKKHQRTAVHAAAYALREEETRCHVVAPCGTGKTLICARLCEDLAASGHALRRLVLFPTLDLLLQTIRVFQADSANPGALIAVCGPLDSLSDLGVPRAGSPDELADMLTGLDRYTVFATYAHLVDSGNFHGTLITAHRRGIIQPWDLIICDEAHRTSGSLDKAWSVVHDDNEIPAARRFYCTATPRIWSADPKYAETLTAREDGLYLVASMDDPDIYGPRVFDMQLSTAIAENLARDYRIVLVAVDHPDLQPRLRRTRTARATDAVALTSLATAVLKTCATYNVRKMITFHRAIADATEFVNTLLPVAEALDGEVTETSHGPVPLRPETIWAHAIHGEAPDRHDKLATFRAEPAPAHLTLLANSRLLGEGVDIPTVDALCFAAPKASVTDVNQALGRALRLHPDGSEVATILVPVYLAAGEDPTDLLNADSLQPLYDMLIALRSHDLRIADRIPTTELTAPAEPAQAHTAQGSETPLAEQRAEPAVELPAERTMPPFGGGDFPEIVATDGQVLTPRQIAQVMTLRTFKPHGATNDWMDMTVQVTAYWEEHGHLGVTRAQAEALRTDPHRVDLYTWLDSQRGARRKGELKQWQISFLDSHGMLWNPADAGRDTFITYAEECARQCGGLAVSVGYEAPDGTRVGERLRNYRASAKNHTIAADLMAELNRIDPNWNPVWPFPWQRNFQIAAHRHRRGESLTQPGDGRAYRTWLRDPGDDLTIDQEELLREIGLAGDDESVLTG